jgi:predicted glycogen debranching enzyme
VWQRERVTVISFGRQVTGDLDDAAGREWLVTDGLGGYAMGTVAGLRTRRYHGLLVVATEPPIGRMMGLVALDPVMLLGGEPVRLSTHEWADGTVAPAGYEHLASFELRDGVPSWRWAIGDVIIECEVAMEHGRSAVGVVHRLVRAPAPVTLVLEALCTWRDVHGERGAAGDPDVQRTDDGFVFENRYRVRGPGFDPADAAWWRGDRHREEAARGLSATEDLWFAGRFRAELSPGDVLAVEAWTLGPSSGGDGTAPERAAAIVAGARRRAADVVMRTKPADDHDRLLALAADQFVVTTPSGPTVVAGYPWFGDWSRDTMTSYEGLFLRTGRWSEGRTLLERAAAGLSEGMLANTADAGGLEYNTVDATPWFLHALARHVHVAGDVDLAVSLRPQIRSIVDDHLTGTRFGIRVGDDGLITQGAPGWALTWMDARVDGDPVTPRTGKPVEVNALWIDGLRALAGILRPVDGATSDQLVRLADRARSAFIDRFTRTGADGLYDVVDPDDASVRPNQLLAASLPFGPLDDASTAAGVVKACAPLVTSIGMRSLSPADARYTPTHRGGGAERDRAYHQGTVWPWLIGPYVDACKRAGVATDGVLDGLLAHLGEWGLGSVSETADAAAPHRTTGCPFQAWSVAELLRAKRVLG